MFPSPGGALRSGVESIDPDDDDEDEDQDENDEDDGEDEDDDDEDGGEKWYVCGSSAPLHVEPTARLTSMAELPTLAASFKLCV